MKSLVIIKKMVRLIIVGMLLASCNSNSGVGEKNVSNFPTKIDSTSPPPKLSCIDLLNEIRKKNRISFSDFNQVFPYGYEKIKLDSSYIFENGLIDSFPNNKNELLIFSKQKHEKNPKYAFLLHFDNKCNLLRIQIKDYLGSDLIEYHLWDTSIEREMDKRIINFSHH